MLTKDEYLTHLSYGVDTCPAIFDAFEELIENYFKLLDTYNNLEKTSYSLECQLHDLYYPNAYKFEDLKVEMFVYDINFDNIFVVAYTTENLETGELYVYAWGCKDGHLTKIKFKENRFFPITKAMFLQEKNKSAGKE